MAKLKQQAQDFLNLKRIAVAGVSRNSREAANAIYRKLKEAGYRVFPVNPAADNVEGDPCYPKLSAIPEGVEGVVIVTPPEAGENIVRECAEIGISRVWMHRSFGDGSVSESAVKYCRDHNISVIAGACPMMFCEPVDFPHKCIRWFLGVTGKLPN